MGYTHYWRRLPGQNDPAFSALSFDVWAIKRLCDRLGVIPLAGPLGTGGVQVTGDLIAFNGADPDSYESFIWERNCRPWDTMAQSGARVFCFCKTALRPYDPAVVAVLLCAAYHYGDAVTLSTDGTARELMPGLLLVRHLFPDRGFTLAPFGIEAECLAIG